MKKIIVLLILCLIVLFDINVHASGSVNVSSGNIKIERGKTTALTINAKECAGLVEIVSSDNNIVSVNVSSYFFDTSLGNSKAVITVTGKNVGNATVKVILKDIASFDGSELSGTKTINVNVSEPVQKNNSSANTSSKSSESKDNSLEETQKKISVERIEIVGYEIDFHEEIYEYIINVPQNVHKLYVIADGNNFSAINDKEVDITNKDFFEIILSNENETRKYKVNIKRENQESINVLNNENDCQNNNSIFNINYVVITLELVNFMAIIIVMKYIKRNRY